MPIRGLREIAYRTRKPVFDNDFHCSKWQKFMPNGHVKLKNVLFAPLIVNKVAKGLLGLANKPGDFTEEDKELAESFGKIASTALFKAHIIGELRKSEEKFRGFFNNSINGIAIHELVFDEKGKAINYRILDVNPQYESIIGKKKRDIQNKLATIIYTVDEPPFLDLYTEVALNDAPVTFETYFEPLDKYFKITAICSGKNKFATIFEDITELKEVNTNLIKSKEYLKETLGQLNFYKDLLLHDMSNILQAISNSADLCRIKIEKSNNVNTILKDTNRITEQVKRGGKLIENIKKIIEVENEEKKSKVKNILPILHESINNIKSAFSNQKIEIKLDVKLPRIQVEANDFLIDVFDNLLINAIVHNENDLKKVNITINEEILYDEKIAQIAIKDNGIGISDKRKEKVFLRGDNTSNNTKGMGIGLSLVKKIINSLGGIIWIEDAVPGKYQEGSVFIIQLPLIL